MPYPIIQLNGLFELELNGTTFSLEIISLNVRKAEDGLF